MRIIAGTLGSRQFESPSGHRTHPMSENIRGALFNALGEIDGLTVLDAFAGSGALSFEAVSRGAASAIALDVDRLAAETVVKNANELGIADKVKAINVNAASWLVTQPEETFDLVLLDPPFDEVQQPLLQRLVARTKPGGVTVLCLPPLEEFELPEDAFSMLTTRNYGDAKLVFYRRNG